MAKGITAFLVVAASILFYFLMLRLGTVFTFLKKVVSVLNPIIYGIVIAYLINPIANFLNGRFFPLFKKKFKSEKRAYGLSNALSVALSIIAFLLLIVALVALVIPQFIIGM